MKTSGYSVGDPVLVLRGFPHMAICRYSAGRELGTAGEVGELHLCLRDFIAVCLTRSYCGAQGWFQHCNSPASDF